MADPDTTLAYHLWPNGVGVAGACRRGKTIHIVRNFGRVAIHPDQVGTINTAYSPSEAEIAEAREIVDAFAEQPDAGTLGIGGRMYDIPHLKAARKTLMAAAASPTGADQ